MKKYVITGTLTISTYTHVEAESIEEAQEKAMERPLMQLPYLNLYPDEEWVVDDLDGEPRNIKVEES